MRSFEGWFSVGGFRFSVFSYRFSVFGFRLVVFGSWLVGLDLGFSRWTGRGQHGGCIGWRG
jgi:hypothetical protein